MDPEQFLIGRGAWGAGLAFAIEADGREVVADGRQAFGALGMIGGRAMVRHARIGDEREHSAAPACEAGPCDRGIWRRLTVGCGCGDVNRRKGLFHVEPEFSCATRMATGRRNHA